MKHYKTSETDPFMFSSWINMGIFYLILTVLGKIIIKIKITTLPV